ncbi:hypothetical protein GCM10022200_13830 [Microbacterium awajiense]|uniref:Integral membrane protein n=1 Tax=Microbacterium awajiense TaxID=415214 RepID=A0ABP7AH95_9MICO
MNRLVVSLLAAVDAAIAVAVGLAAILAPLTVLWVFGFTSPPDWAALWPASATVWQFGNLVPLEVTLPAGYISAAGIAPAAETFALTLAPLAFAGFTAVFAARSGVRASRAETWITGCISGILVFAALAAGIALTGRNDIGAVELWQAVVIPTAVFAVPLVAAAVATEWIEAETGIVARVRDSLEADVAWGPVVGLAFRGATIVVVGLVGLGSLLSAVALVLRGGEVIALYETAHVDVLGAIIVTLGQLAYLPTIALWGMAFLAGPGFAVGVGTAVSPAGTSAGVLPGIPLLGIVPESTSPWLMLVVLVPVALAAFAGWVVRSRLVAHGMPAGAAVRDAAVRDVAAARIVDGAAPRDPSRTAALQGLLATAPIVEPEPDDAADVDVAEVDSSADDPVLPRLVIVVGMALLAAGAAALLAFAASGALGPDAMAEFGPSAGPVALAVGLETLVGAGILILSPRRHSADGSARPGTSRRPS